MKNRLIQIHNSLSKIHVCGEDAINMAQCLIELRNMVKEIDEEKHSSELTEDDD